MRAFVLAVALATPLGGRAEEPARPDASTAPTPFLVLPGAEGSLVLREGGTLRGRLVETGAGGDAIELTDGSVVRLRAGSVVGLGEGAGGPTPGTRLELTLADDRLVKGSYRSRDDDALTIDAGQGPVRVEVGEIRSARWAGSQGSEASWRDEISGDPARTRLLQAPTAFRLEPWEVTLSAVGIVEPSVSVGIGRFVLLSTSFVIPTLYAEGYDQAATVSLSAGTGFGRLHLAAGLRAVIEQAGTQGSLFATASYGTPRAHVTLHAGPPPVGAVRDGRFGKTAGAVGGALAVWEHVSLLAETWVGKGAAGELDAQVGAGARFSWRFLSADLAAVVRGSEVSPWLSVAAGIR